MMFKFALFLLFCGMGLSLSAADFFLVKNGKGSASLLLPENADKKLAKHVTYFNAELAKSTKAPLPIVKKASGKGNIIIFNPIKTAYIDRNQYTIDFPAKNTMRITGSPLGIRYALNSIVEKAGIRYPFPGKDGAYYPLCKELKFPRKKVTKDAAFRIFRSIFSMDDEWQTNLNCQLLDSRELCNHSVDRTFPLKKYGKGEWVNKILPVRYGKRETKLTPNIWEPCYSNPATAAEAVKNISAYLRKRPNQSCYSLVVNDGWNFYCMCKECEKANKGPKTTALEPQLKNRSNVYYKWVNKVAKEIKKEFPHVYLGVLAYNCVKNPPSFKLEDNVVVTIACEAYALSDPTMKKQLQEMYRFWKERAKYVGIWEYGYGAVHYSLPRVFFKYQAEHIKWFAKNKGEVGFVEAMPNFGQGPHLYMYLKLLYDPNIDVETTLEEWYIAAVGKEAAPYLKKYYELWNKFWDGPARKSPWYKSVKYVYLSLGIDGSYHNAVPSDLAGKCRLLMEKVVTNANQYGDAGQKKRAFYLMKAFELYEASIKLNGNGLLTVEGSLASRKDALKLAKALPEITQGVIRRQEVAREIKGSFPSWWGGIYRNFYPRSFYRKYDKIAIPSCFQSLLPYLEYPEVLAAYKEFLKYEKIPSQWKELLQILANPKGIKSLIEDYSFEKDEAKKWKPAGVRSNEEASLGKYSGKFFPQSGTARYIRIFQNKPGRRYLAMAKVFVPSDYPPGRAKAKIGLNGRTSYGYNTISYSSPVISLVPGQWNMVYTIANPGKRAVKGEVILTVTGMKKGDHFYFDDLKLVEVGE